MDGLMSVCHATRKGGHMGSHWPTHTRASALLGVPRCSTLFHKRFHPGIGLSTEKGTTRNNIIAKQAITTFKRRPGCEGRPSSQVWKPINDEGWSTHPSGYGAALRRSNDTR